MKTMIAGFASVLAVFMVIPTRSAIAHCDTLGGPVVADAQRALGTGDVTVILKWVKRENEPEVKRSFDKAVRVRKMGPEAMELADIYFIENIVRIHRAGEGAPYTGLKPAGAIDPAIAETDRALESGSADRLIKMVSGAVAQGTRERFHRALEAKQHADENVEAGRRYVAAYVDLTHYIEKLDQGASTMGEHDSGHGHGH